MGAVNVLFNAKVFIDFIHIEGDPVLHIIDDAAYFSAAQVVESPKTESVGKALFTLWVADNTGLPKNGFLMIAHNSDMNS